MAVSSLAAGAYAATQLLSSPVSASSAPKAGAPSFADTLSGIVESVAQSGASAERQASAAAQGKADMVDVVTAVAESESALETLVAVRDKVIQAYEEIMRMPV
ncbi:flagellar hook-basal body complex protein FliE [Alsobacter sp. SYSU M60028]|uniref:Flagellar hook-basal body complex protein FliE n=1 Tax=Alsobacter ponti TaxID=2962936 RepID=A0ABT1LFY7_9HYPH|nr:flagellar hook-basal body complex protein FliE [Alsobacter ponti]MCP8940407.1 flagellar hook-basal body complex protein FliE [Alsobacter ponti]